MIKYKQKTVVIGLILLFVFSATATIVPVTNAHTPPWTIPSWCYISANNNPIGVNQDVVIVFWLNENPRTRTGAYGDSWTFYVDVTQPDGTKETLGPITSDPVGSGWLVYKPKQVGTYTMISRFPGKTYTGLPLYPGRTIDNISGAEYVNDTLKPSTSDPLKLVVQQQAITPWRETPLPTEYWKRPITVMNRDWWQIASNWLGGQAQTYPPGSSGAVESYSYSPAPDTAHILWSKSAWYGGLMDARYGNLGYQTSHYDGLSFSPPIILNGRLYYNVANQPKMGWYCLDLYTGEELYFHNTTGPVNYAMRSDASGALLQEWLSFGQILNYESPNEHGGRPYLWSTYGPGMPTGKPSSGGQSWPNNNATWMMFDSWTGNYICSVANVSTAGTNVYGVEGSILYYNIGTSMYGKPNAGGAQRLTIWNSTRAIEMTYADPGSQYPLRNFEWCWRPFVYMVNDGSKGFSANVTISPAVQGSIRAIVADQYIIGGTAGSNNEDGTVKGKMWCLSLKQGEIGKLLWSKEFTPPSTAGNLTLSAPSVDAQNGMFYFSETKTRTRWGFSLDTGLQVWKSEPESPWNYYGMSDFTYQDKYFGIGSGSAGGGELIAYNAKTGKIEWIYTARQEGFESPYGNYPISLACITADGKIFTSTSEHSPTQPLWRGSRIRCINATNGQEIWSINNWGAVRAADNVLVALNMYDGKIYCYGKGPSATTIAVQDDVVTQGDKILLKGTVTDQSPDAKGTPAIADENMSPWMEYLHMQQTKPTNAIGVKVHLTATDPNGNYQDIGTTTSDVKGSYAIPWTPPVPGLYKVVATFEGSKSYFASDAETSFYVNEKTAAASPKATSTPVQTNPSTVAPTLTTAPTPSPVIIPPTSAEPTTTYLAIGATIVVIVIAVAALILRRRK